MKIHEFAVNPNKQKGGAKKRKLERKALRLAAFSMLFGLGFLALFFLLFPFLLGFRVCFCWGLLPFEKIPLSFSF
jgi:hypothetical protein